MYTRSGPNDLPTSRVTGRLAADPLGSLRAGITIQPGSRTWQFAGFPLSVTLGAAIDPVDGSVWVAGVTPSTVKPPTNDSASIEIARLQLPAPTSTVAADSPRLGNVSVRTTLAAAQTLIVGFVVNGGAKEMLVRAAGPALAQFGLASPMADPRLAIFQDGVKVFENDDWTPGLSARFATAGAFSFPAASKDAALVQSLAGANNVLLTGTDPGLLLAEIYDVGGGTAGRVSNISARNRVGQDADILIAGFSLTGTGAKRVLVRAVGPSLAAAPFNVPGALVDPKLELYDANAVKIAGNDNWEASLAATFSSVGAFALLPGSKDAALIVTLEAGRSYTAQVRGADGGTGEALIEVYELP